MPRWNRRTRCQPREPRELPGRAERKSRRALVLAKPRCGAGKVSRRRAWWWLALRWLRQSSIVIYVVRDPVGETYWIAAFHFEPSSVAAAVAWSAVSCTKFDGGAPTLARTDLSTVLFFSIAASVAGYAPDAR